MRGLQSRKKAGSFLPAAGPAWQGCACSLPGAEASADCPGLRSKSRCGSHARPLPATSQTPPHPCAWPKLFFPTPGSSPGAVFACSSDNAGAPCSARGGVLHLPAKADRRVSCRAALPLSLQMSATCTVSSATVQTGCLILSAKSVFLPLSVLRTTGQKTDCNFRSRP